MPIFAYLAIPKQGALQQLSAELGALPYCEVIAAENENVLVLVTDTPNDPEEKALQQKLHGLDSLQSLSMTFGHSDIP
jgi:nitrate reductase NapAB chaperone NapD